MSLLLSYISNPRTTIELVQPFRNFNVTNSFNSQGVLMVVPRLLVPLSTTREEWIADRHGIEMDTVMFFFDTLSDRSG